MKRKIKNSLLVLAWIVGVLFVWTAYVAHEGFFYFSPATPYCDGEIGAIAVAKRSCEVFSVGSDGRAFGLWCSHSDTLINDTSPGRFVLSKNGTLFCQYDFDMKPLWIVWQDTGNTNWWNHGRHFELPCVWPYHYLGLRRAMADLSKPTIITSARVTQAGLYSLGPKAVIGTNGFVRGGVWPPIFVQSTTNIYEGSADLFGLRYEIDGSFSGRPTPLVKRWTHPPILDPRTGEVRTQTDLQASVGESHYSFRGLRGSRYLVPGVWTFQLLHNGTNLCQQHFVLIKTNTSIAIESASPKSELPAESSRVPASQP